MDKENIKAAQNSRNRPMRVFISHCREDKLADVRWQLEADIVDILAEKVSRMGSEEVDFFFRKVAPGEDAANTIHALTQSLARKKEVDCVDGGKNETNPARIRLVHVPGGGGEEVQRYKPSSSLRHTELNSFDAQYVQLLRQGDPSTEQHFIHYFGQLLRIKLRSRKLPPHVIEDVQQETFLRVLVAVRMDQVRHPERFPAYVNSVCKNILLEHYRRAAREQWMDLEAADGPDAAADLEATMIADERRDSVHAMMKQLGDLGSKVMRGILLDRDSDKLCRELSVTREYLWVLMHRAIKIFRTGTKGKKGFPAEGGLSLDYAVVKSKMR